MEFPSLGKHCSVSACKQLDFLPYDCDACHKIHCAEHRRYEDHQCPHSYTKDARVPECPICGKPVPVASKGMDPNFAMDQHIRSGCTAGTNPLKNTMYQNSCTFNGCKAREAVPMRCAVCRLNFCLKHRLEKDHECSKVAGSNSYRAASARQAAGQPRPSGGNTVGPFKVDRPSTLPAGRPGPSWSAPGAKLRQAANGQLSEDDALAIALAESQQQTPQRSVPDDELDEATARVIQQSLDDLRRQQQREQQQREQQQICNLS